jgi:acetolactate synthase-1/2/3 large subunit
MPQQAPPTGAQLLIASLLAHGVDTVFGCPGAAVLAIYDELYKHRGQIRHILVSHEQQAAHAADGYARAAGRPAVCIATSGPGATNLLTGIAAAFMDSTPGCVRALDEFEPSMIHCSVRDVYGSGAKGY